MQYIFLDESGKPEIFSSTGKNLVELGNASKFLVMSAITCKDYLDLQLKVNQFRSVLLSDDSLKNIFSNSYTISNFHAYDDHLPVKIKFLEFIANLNIEIDVIVAEKLKFPNVLQKASNRLYGVVAGNLLSDLHDHETEQTEIIFSRKDSKLKAQQEIEIECEENA